MATAKIADRHRHWREAIERQQIHVRHRVLELRVGKRAIFGTHVHPCVDQLGDGNPQCVMICDIPAGWPVCARHPLLGGNRYHP